MEVLKKLEALRAVMKNKGIDAYIIPSADPHQSEYVADRFKVRESICQGLQDLREPWLLL